MKKKVIFISVIFLLIDQITKIIMLNYLSLGEKKIIINNFFSLNLVYNDGASFSMLSGARWVLIAIAIIFLFMLYKLINKYKKTKLNIVAFSMLFGGLVGNLIDRVIHGHVIDFLDFIVFKYDYPVFNFADTFIVLGVIGIIISTFIGGEKRAN